MKNSKNSTLIYTLLFMLMFTQVSFGQEAVQTRTTDWYTIEIPETWTISSQGSEHAAHFPRESIFGTQLFRDYFWTPAEEGEELVVQFSIDTYETDYEEVLQFYRESNPMEENPFELNSLTGVEIRNSGDLEFDDGTIVESFRTKWILQGDNLVYLIQFSSTEKQYESYHHLADSMVRSFREHSSQ